MHSIASRLPLSSRFALTALVALAAPACSNGATPADAGADAADRVAPRADREDPADAARDDVAAAMDAVTADDAVAPDAMAPDASPPDAARDGGALPAECALPAGPVISAATFGAVGDGRTDDTAALRAAFAALARDGGTLRLGAGLTYVISGTLRMGTATGFGIDGNGSTLRIANGTPTTGAPLLFATRDYVIANLTVDGNRAGRTPREASGAHNITVTGGSNYAFCNVTSNNSTCDGFYVGANSSTDVSTYPRRGLFQGCSADNSYRQGMSVINAVDLRVIGGAYTNTNGTLPQAGIDLEPNDGSASPGISDILVRGVRFEGNAGAGLTGGGPATITRVTIEDCTFANNALATPTGFRVGFDHSLVQNNTFTRYGSTATSGILVFRGSADTNFDIVRNNTFVDNPSTFRVVEIAGTGPSNYFVDNVFERNGGTSVNTHGVTTACVAGNRTAGVPDRPAGSCGALPDVGYAPR